MLFLQLAYCQLLPDLATAKIEDVFYQFINGKEFIRFSNGIANLGPGTLRVTPGPSEGGQQSAFQEILNEAGGVVERVNIGSYEYHPQHDHYHIAQVASYKLYKALDTGYGGSFDTQARLESAKVSFCLMDTYNFETLEEGSAGTYQTCSATVYQGISPKWVDIYGANLPGQEMDISAFPKGTYYLVSTVNPNNILKEVNSENNSAWVSFTLSDGTLGRRTIAVVSHSRCGQLCNVPSEAPSGNDIGSDYVDPSETDTGGDYLDPSDEEE